MAPFAAIFERLWRWLPLCAAALALLPFLPLVVPDQRIIPENLACDYATFQLPQHEFSRREWLARRFPLWMPNVGCGIPLHAAQQAAITYPLLAPLVVIFGANYGLRLSLALHIVLGFVGQYRLARALRISRAGASYAAAIYSTSGFLVAHLMEGHVGHVLAHGLVPWFFWAIVRVLAAPSVYRTIVLSIIAAAMALIGHPQVPFYAGLAAIVWCFCALWQSATRRLLSNRVLALGAAAAIAALLAMVQLIPTLELLDDGEALSERGQLSYAYGYALQPQDLLRVWCPSIFGNHLRGIEVSDLLASQGYHEQVAFVGVGALALAAFGLSRRSVRPWQWLLAALVLSSVGIALGPATPVFEIAGNVAPGLLSFRCPGRILALAELFLAVLAARGLDQLIRGSRPGAVYQRVFVWASVLGLLAFVLWPFHRRGFRIAAYDYASQYVGWELLVTAAITLASILLLASRWVLGRRFALRAFVSAWLALAFVDMWCGSTRDFRLVDFPPRTPPPGSPADDRWVRLAYAPSYPAISRIDLRTSGRVLWAVEENRSLLGINEGGVMPRAIEELHFAVAVNTQFALRLASCTHIECPPADWIEISAPLPRIRFLPARHLAAASTPLKDANEQTIGAYDSETVCTLIGETPQRLEVEVKGVEGGLLVVADTFYAGWKARVDDVEVPVSKVHDVFRGVPVASGRHRIVLSYQPIAFVYGAAGTALGALVIVVSLVAARIRAARRRTM